MFTTATIANYKNARLLPAVCWLLIATASACEPPSDADPGATGPEVSTLQKYLGSFGYLPNESLERLYPNWRPVTDKTPTPGVFDETTRVALLVLQRNFGIEPSGLLDAPTRALISQPRCGVPDNIQPPDGRNKFGLAFNKWNRTELRWMYNDAVATLAGISKDQFRAATRRALATLLANTTLTERDVTDTNPSAIDIHIVIRTDNTPCGGNPTIACASFPDGADTTSVLWIDNRSSFSVDANTPGGKVDLETLLLHELGHAIGLDHTALLDSSPAAAPVMHPLLTTGPSNKRGLADDDKIAIGTYYGLWQRLPGCARDIATGNGDAWMIGCFNRVAGSGFPIFKWNPALNTWTTEAAGGLAFRIAVTSSGIPWVVTESGTIWRRTTSDPTTGSWERIGGCAGEVGAGGGQVWITGCTASGGTDGFGNVFRWSGNTWEMIFDGVQGRAITADAIGRPIMTVSTGAILRRSTNSAALGSWSSLTAGAGGSTGISGFAMDVAAASPSAEPSLSVQYAWAATAQSGFNVFTWDEQKKTTNGATAFGRWFLDRSGGFPGGVVTRVAAGKTGPWVVDAIGAIFRKASEP